MTETNDIGCEQALKRLFEFIDRELPGSEHDRVDQHLRTCRSCFSRMEFERRLKDQLSSLPEGDAPASARAKVRALIKGF